MNSPFLIIQSRRNPRLKRWKRLVLHPESSDCPWIAIEGAKNIRDLAVIQCPELLLFSRLNDDSRELMVKARESIRMSGNLLGELSSVQTHQGLLAFFPKPDWDWSQLTPRVLYLDRLQDPGNLGTLLRTAHATGMFSILTSPGTVSCYNPKVVRASAASIFAVPFLEGVGIGELIEKGYRTIATTTQAGPSYFEANLDPPFAFMVGNEGSGLTEVELTEMDDRLHIPMLSSLDSLNAAVAGSLVMYEAVRRTIQPLS